MMRRRANKSRSIWGGSVVLAALAVAVAAMMPLPLPVLESDAAAQTAQKGKRKQTQPKQSEPAAEDPTLATQPAELLPDVLFPDPNGDPNAGKPADPMAERVEADVSTRSIAITSGYSGAEILVFGAIENSRQPSAESGYYDIVVVVEGAPQPLMLRRKSRVAGLWVNTTNFAFNAVPTYYAVSSTRPFDEFMDAIIQDELAIGIDAVRMAPAAQSAIHVTSAELLDYKAAVARLKEQQKLFQRNDYGVIFTGRSLFRCRIELPANVPVGPLVTRVYLFHDGKLLSRYQSRVALEREGIELWLHGFAFNRPFLYGLSCVLLAVAAGLIASAVFRRRTV